MRLFAKRIEEDRSKWAFFRWHDVIIDDVLYLSRFQILKTPWFSIKLHWFHRPDPDRDLHDHPWAFVSFILRGGYTELINYLPSCPLSIMHKHIRWFNFKNTVTSHRVITIKPGTLTLVITGPKKKSWGFYDEETSDFTHWRDYDKVKHS